MRPQTQDEIRTDSGPKPVPHVDIIKQTRRLVTGLGEKQRFRIAREHLENALAYKTPRLDIFYPSTPRVLKVCYDIQTSIAWRTFLLVLAYMFMYLVIWEQEPSTALIIGESLILLVLWLDVLMEIYHKSHEGLNLASKFQLRFYARVVTLIVLIIDFVLFVTVPSLSVRPLLVIRCFLPLFYDANVRKMFEALLFAYKDILVLLFFYASIVVFFAIIANQIIQLPRDAEVDEFGSNYRELDKTIFIMYALSTYDAYPDNQLVAIRHQNWVYAFFILFIILNIFFFATIPPILVFNSFRETRSKIVLVDEIKQQHSLLMSFVSLGEENLNISLDKVIRFLLYVYKNKVRYVNHITEVCRALDENDNKTIHIKEYMHLCEILQTKTSMLPPQFDDLPSWLHFRKTINDTFRVKDIISTKWFKIANSLLILFTFANGLLSLFTRLEAFNIIDDVLILIFVVEILVKIVGMGVENFFTDLWNKLDFLLVGLALALELTPQQYSPHNSDVLLKMSRIFRITTLLKNIRMRRYLSDSIYTKVTRLISQIGIIIPIVLRFLPLYMITFYILGTTGMHIFRQANIVNPDKSPYDIYEEYSNFTTFICSQLLFVQILVESQWSTLAYDFAFKYSNFGWVMLFFVLSHALLVTVLTSLIKGVTWEVYNSVHEELNERTAKIIKNKIREEKLQRRRDKVEDIKARLDERDFVMPNNLIAKELVENKIDEHILKKLKLNYEKNKIVRERKRRRSDIIKFLMPERNLLSDELEDMDGKSARSSTSELVFQKGSQFVELDDIEGQDGIQEGDIEEEMEKILTRLTLNSATSYSETIVYPKTLTEFLEYKIKPLKANFMDEFDPGEEESKSDDNKDVFATGINNLLGIQTSEREQKAMILKYMVEQGMISEQASARAMRKPIEVDPAIDYNWIMRKAFLSDTNEKLIKKFEIEYFSNLYGKSFKEISKVTIEPLLRLESKLTYSLRNIVRYSKMSQQKFFTVLATIEDMMSNQLLKKGSLFKFVYQIDCLSDMWFSIELKESSELRLHFIKNGIWVYHKGMKSDEIMVAEDVFDCENAPNARNEAILQKYVKMLYSSFESLAFCLSHDKHFFQHNPRQHIHNLFAYCRDVSKARRLRPAELGISKIMLVVLSREDEREEPLKYELTSLEVEEKREKTTPFRRGESENETFAKLKQMELLDHERVVENEGMPFNNIANLMLDVQSILREHETNFIFQVETFLNAKLKESS